MASFFLVSFSGAKIHKVVENIVSMVLFILFIEQEVNIKSIVLLDKVNTEVISHSLPCCKSEY